MSKSRIIIIAAAICLLVLASISPTLSAFYDIGSGGQPVLNGNLGGFVTGDSNLLANLIVTISFGELSPINTNPIVKAVVPIAIRSSDDYQVAVSLSGSVAPDPQAVQLSDIGFGIQNVRPLGARAQICTKSQSIINPLFNNDPSITITTNPAGRAVYQSSLANLGASTVVLTGPKLSKDNLRRTDNAWGFDAILVVAPGYYSPGNFTLTLTFTI